MTSFHDLTFQLKESVKAEEKSMTKNTSLTTKSYFHQINYQINFPSWTFKIFLQTKD